ncbi:MAG: F0F1 ATP synthase subunit epsilon [Anaerostipes sp.]|nr:F0F1 ATP synthase subunit epsilon [Anaerostipes sp.]
MAETFYFEIIASDKKFYSGACEHVIFPSIDGKVGILANHEDMVTALVPGELRYKVGNEWHEAVVGEGFADVTRDFVVVLADTVERPEDIDINRAKEAKARAEERLKQKQSRLQYYHTQAALSRAMARLKVTGKSIR